MSSPKEQSMNHLLKKISVAIVGNFLLIFIFFMCCDLSLSPEPVAYLEGHITANLRLDSKSSPYFLKGYVVIDSGYTLIIEPGTIIKGMKGTNASFIISQGAKIIAIGIPFSPIIFTSDQPEGSRKPGDWGGIIINGKAPINCGNNQGKKQGEGETGIYGGADSNDNSGIIKYVRVEFGGSEYSINKKFQGFSFRGVGKSTIVDHIQVHKCSGDGIAFFGGTVNAKYIFCSGNAGDSFVWTEGWQGKGQFWIAQKYINEADNGFDGENNDLNLDTQPRSYPQIFNFTLIGVGESGIDGGGILLRKGTGGNFSNGIVIHFEKAGIYIDNSISLESNLSVKSTIFYRNNPTIGNSTINQWILDPEFHNIELNSFEPSPVIEPLNYITPDFKSQNIAISSVFVEPPFDGFFEPVTFIGGMGPTDDWTLGWINTN